MKPSVMLLPHLIMISKLNLLHISLKRKRNNFLVDAGIGLLQIRQSRADNCEASH